MILFRNVVDMSWMLTIELRAEPATVRLVRKLLAAAARFEGASELEAHLIEVAVGEVLASGRSGNENSVSGSVSVNVELRGDRFIVSIAKDRDAPTQTSIHGDPEDDYALGWGLHVIAQVMDEVEIRQPVKTGQTLELRLVKRIG